MSGVYVTSHSVRFSFWNLLYYWRVAELVTVSLAYSDFEPTSLYFSLIRSSSLVVGCTRLPRHSMWVANNKSENKHKPQRQYIREWKEREREREKKKVAALISSKKYFPALCGSLTTVSDVVVVVVFHHCTVVQRGAIMQLGFSVANSVVNS